VSAAALIAVGIAVAMWALSLFVLDWADDVGFSDFRRAIGSVSGMVDNLVKWNLKGLGYAWAAVAVAATGLFVIGGLSSQRIGHVITALVAAGGAAMSALVVVRLFRGPGPDPEIGAWLLPAGYLVLLAGIVISASRDR